MTNLSRLNILLSQELGDSETINKTVEQRNNCINDACVLTYEERKWPEKYVNTTTQAVDGVITIPYDYDINTAIWFGKNQKYGFNNLNFNNQTDFFTGAPFDATVTELNGVQVIRLTDKIDKGYSLSQKIYDSSIGIGDIVNHSKIGDTFIATNDLLEGAPLRLNKIGSPTGTLKVEIFATVGGFPTGNALATGLINLNNIKTTSEYHWAQFLLPTTLISGDLYSISVTPSYAISPTDYIQWSYSSTSQKAGNQILFDGGVWTNGAGDQTYLLAIDYFNFQYVKSFVAMTSPSDDNGLTTKFDKAVSRLAAGIMYELKMEDQQAANKFYGLGGNQDRPTKNSAFGLLNIIWGNVRVNSMRTGRRLKTIYESDSNKYNSRYGYPYL